MRPISPSSRNKRNNETMENNTLPEIEPLNIVIGESSDNSGLIKDILIVFGIVILMAGIIGLWYWHPWKSNVVQEEPIVIPDISQEVVELPYVFVEDDAEQKALVLQLAKDNWQTTLRMIEEIKKAKVIAEEKRREAMRSKGGGGSSVSEDLPDISTPSEFDGITFDLNEDGIVNATDIKLLRNWKEVWYQNYNNSLDTYVNESTSDWDKNGYINQTDKDLFEGYWGRLYNHYINVLNVIEDNDSNETI